MTAPCSSAGLAQTPRREPRIRWLVIGFGNTLRRDDGAGVRVAEEIERLALPGVRVQTCHQLTPELAEAIAAVEHVVFVDASAEPRAGVELKTIQPACPPTPLAHAADPRTLLFLARELFGYAPKAWLLTQPAPDLGLGEGLSLEAEAGVRVAISKLRQLIAPGIC